MTLNADDVEELRGITDALSIDEVEQVYLPLSRLLNLHVSAVHELHRVTGRFLGTTVPPVPYVIAIAGSVSAGKSTTARVLRTLLARWSDHPHVELVTTDGFLYPNRTLEERDLMARKGFPESYDRARLVRFLSDLKSGVSPVEAPVYSHLRYDIVPEELQIVAGAEIVIIEGLNVLQGGAGHPVVVSDFVDFSIYVDAAEDVLEGWFLERFQRLRETAFRDPASFFHSFAAMPDSEAVALATGVWERINLVNLRENILPTRARARLILEKGPHHTIERVLLRRL